MSIASSNSIAQEVLHIIMRYRRSPIADPCLLRPCVDCFARHIPKLNSFISRGIPIHFILPSFPAKSSNPRKVLGHLPDMAERIALGFLEDCCRRIEAIYPPGARITICSDGRVFSDLVRVREGDVTAYLNELKLLINKLEAHSLDVFNLDDEFDESDFDEQRRQLLLRYARPLEELHNLIKSGSPLLSTFNGIARFLFEDMITLEGHNKTRNNIRLETKALAYRVIQRSLSWSALIAKRFPEAVRLSIHPQLPHSEKIGIYLVETLDNWLTPWHGVAIDIDGQFFLVKRHEAESMGALLVELNGRPSYFILRRDRDLEEADLRQTVLVLK